MTEIIETTGRCVFYCIGIYNKHCLSLQKLKNDNTQHTHPLKFFIIYSKSTVGQLQN